MKSWHKLTSVLMFSVIFSSISLADPYPPTWDNGAGTSIHYQPVAWPSEPANPVNCGTSCGDWKPYTRFQQNMNDPRTQDPSNGGTSPQAYVNVASSCSDKNLPSIYYYLHQGATPADDVLMFRWRVESAPNNYAAGPSAGNYGASNPWSSALWTVFFDTDGSGYRSLAAHLDGSSGAPASSIDRIVGIWGEGASQSLDYINDSRIHLLGHNPTAFVGPTGKIMNFANSLTPSESWPNGASENNWNYGTTRAKTVTQNSCSEYFIDYQIPIALLDASGIGGPKISRSTPISMLFCTANSLNNPFQKDCAINKSWAADAGKTAPFGDYLSFNQTTPYSQPIISKVEATPPNSCPGNYVLKATVQDTLALQSGNVISSVQSVDFFYWLDTDGDGTADEVGGQWTKITPTSTLVAGSLNQWTASWDTSSLPKGKYLIGAQAVDDNTKLDDGMTPTGINNRTFSYLEGDTANKIYIGGSWQSGQQVLFPGHTPTQSPTAQENWYGNPDVTGQQIAIVGTAINSCGVAPTMTLSADKTSVIAGDPVVFTLTFANPVANTQAISFSQINAVLPAGFTYQNSTTVGSNGLGTADPSVSSQTLTWNYGSPVNLAAGSSMTLVFTATATSTAGYYNVTGNASTSFGSITAEPLGISVDSARLNLNITPSVYSIAADDTTTVTFTFNYSNDSTFALTSGTITSTLPVGATYVSCSGGSACGNSSGNLSWTLGDLSAQSSSSVSVTLKLPTSWSSSSLSLSGSINATAPDASNVNVSASSSIAVTGYSFTSPAAFSLTKTANAVQVAPGGNITYTIAYENYGGTSATSVVITDVLPAGLTYVSSTGGGVNSSGTVTWSVGSVAAGASGSVTVTASVATPFTYTNPVVNSASIDWSGGSTVSSNGISVGVTGQSCSVFYFQSATANVGFDGTQKIAATSPVPISSDTGTSVTVTAPISGASYLEALRFYQDPATSADVPFDGNITTNIYIDRANGQGLNIRTTVYDYNSTTGAKTQLAQNTQLFNGSAKGLLSFSVTPTGTLAKNHRLLWVYEVRSNHASQTVQVQLQYAGTVANAISGGTTFANSNAQYCITPPANLDVDVSVDDSSINENTTPTLTYTIQYINTGSVNATNSSLTNSLPSGFTNCEASNNGSTWFACSNVAGSTHTFSLGTVNSGASGTVYVRGVVPSGTTGGSTLTNTASISSDQTASLSGTAETDVLSLGVSGTPNIVLLLSADQSSVVPGENVIYTLKAINIGDASATNVVITNVLPVQSYYTYDSCTSCSESSGTLTWNAGTFTAGQTKTYTYTMSAGSSGLSAGVYTISDNLSATGDASVSATSNTVAINISGNPELSASISATPNSGLAPSDIITYNATVQNIGNATATSVSISNPIPENTEYYADLNSSVGSASFDTVNNRIVINFGDLSASASETYSFKVRVKSLASGNTNIVNTATASASNAEQKIFSTTATASAAASLELSQSLVGSSAYPSASVTNNATNSSSIFVNTTASLQLNQLIKIGNQVRRIVSLGTRNIGLDSSVTVTAGDAVIGSLTLNLSYRNSGDATATNVSLDDVLPNGLGFYSAAGNSSAPSQGASGTVSWSLGSLVAGETGNQSIVVFPTGVTGSLTVAGSLQASNTTTANANINVVLGGISLKKETTTATLVAGSPATYRITLTNSLASPVTGISVTDTLSSGFSYVSSTATVGGVANEPQFAGSDADHLMPEWTGLTVAANSSLVIEFQANTAASLGGGTYQNELTATVPSGIGVTPFDAISSQAEDVTLLGSNTGLLNGHVFYTDRNGASNFDQSSDLPLANVRVEIYKTGADCSDPYSATCYVVYTNAQGYFEKIVAAEDWYVKVVASGDLDAGWNQAVGSNDSLVTVPDQSSVTDENGFTMATSSSSVSSSSSQSSVSSASLSSSDTSSQSSASSSVASSSSDSSSNSSSSLAVSSSIPSSSSVSSDTLSSASQTSSSLSSSSDSSSQLSASSLASSSSNSSSNSSSSLAVPSSTSSSSASNSSFSSATQSSSMPSSSSDASSSQVVSSSSSSISSVNSSSQSSVISSSVSSEALSSTSQSSSMLSSSSDATSSAVSSSASANSSVISASSSSQSTLSSDASSSATQSSSIPSSSSDASSSQVVSSSSSSISSADSSSQTSVNSSSVASQTSFSLVDLTGNNYSGETLEKNKSKGFKLMGGKGPIKIIASVLQSGSLQAEDDLSSSDANSFFNNFSARLIDNGNGQFEFIASRSGVYTITFVDTDGQQLTTQFIVHPQIGFISTQQQSTQGVSVTVDLTLDDDPVEYPVTFHIKGTNTNLAQDLASDLYYQINQGRKLRFTFMPIASDGNISFVLDQEALLNADLGGLIQHSVILKAINQLPLNLRLSSTQQGEPKTLVKNSDGLVALTSSLTGDQYIYDWSGSDPALQIGSATTSQVNSNPINLSGVYKVVLKVTERNSPFRSSRVEIYLRVIANIPTVYQEFVDEENLNRLPICMDGGMRRVGACSDELKAIYMETLEEYQLKLGVASDYASWSGNEFALSIEPDDIVDLDGKLLPNNIDREYSHLGYRVDFELTGLKQVGQTAPIVVPLKPGLVIPPNAVWRKYHDNNWRIFVSDSSNSIASTKRQFDGLCPWAGSESWKTGLNQGDDCVLLMIQDGGPNDADGKADGIIRDPSVLAVKGQEIEVTTVGQGSSGGGSLGLVWLLLLSTGLCVIYIQTERVQRLRIMMFKLVQNNAFKKTDVSKTECSRNRGVFKE